MKVLVTGIAGQLGHDVMNEYPMYMVEDLHKFVAP